MPMRANHQNMLRISRVFLAASVLTSGAFAQQAVPPPPKPKDDGPSLQVTMQFIQDKLNDEGTFNFALFVHDDIGGSDWVIRKSITQTNFVADSNLCRLSFHWTLTDDGRPKGESNVWFNLKAVKSLSVMTMEQSIKLNDADAGRTGRSSRADPPVVVLSVKVSGAVRADIAFHDEDTANRVAKALNHAVELCGGGQPEPF